MPKKITTEKEDELIRLFVSGMTIEESAEGAGISRTQAWEIMRRRGVTAKDRPGGENIFEPNPEAVHENPVIQDYFRGKPIAQIAEDHEITKSRIYKILDINGIEARRSKSSTYVKRKPGKVKTKKRICSCCGRNPVAPTNRMLCERCYREEPEDEYGFEDHSVNLPFVVPAIS